MMRAQIVGRAAAACALGAALSIAACAAGVQRQRASAAGEYVIRNHTSCFFHVAVIEHGKEREVDVLQPSERTVIRLEEGQRLSTSLRNAPGNRSSEDYKRCTESGSVRIERIVSRSSSPST